jgi:hypothetical protein
MKRLPSVWRALLAASIGANHCAPSLAQQPATLQDFRQVDYFWAQNPQLFQNLWLAAHTQTVRVAVLGDSQETSPGGRGSQFMPLLNYEMWKRFGNVPETPAQGCNSYGGGVPPADWMMRGACAAPGAGPTRLAADQVLPNISPAAISTLNGQVNLTHAYYGQLSMLQQDAIDVDPGAAIPTNTSYFNTAGVIKARIFAATNPSSGEIAYRALPTDSNAPSYFSPATTTGTLAPGLQSATFAVKSADTAALDFNGKRYMVLEASGSDDNELTDIVGLRFFNETRPEGVTISSLAHGGYMASNFLANHGAAGDMFRAFGFHLAVLQYGANDAGNSVTAEQFQANIKAIIASLRAWMNDPNFPVVLIADVYREALTAAQMSEFDRYVGAELAIAQADSHVMVINTRRLMEDLGWNGASGQSGQFLLDTVHYSAFGAKALAAAEAAALLNEIRVAACMSDPYSAQLQSTATLTVELGGTTPCSGYGQYTVAQVLTLNQPTLNVVLTNGFTPSVGQRFKLLSWGSLVGTFKGVSLPQLSAPLTWDTSALYTTGTVAVAPPAAPAISIISGADQSLTQPAAPAPVTFAVSGAGPLTVTAHSSNPTLLPDSGIAVDSTCGSAMLTCVASLAIAPDQTGAATVSLNVEDAYGQSGATTADIVVSPPVSGGSSTGGNSAGGSGTPGSDTGGSSTGAVSGGGGGLDLLLLGGLAALAVLRAAVTNSRFKHDRTVIHGAQK